MLNFAINIAFCAIGLAMLLCLVRLVRGPDAADRILALDTLYINAIALLIVLGIRMASPVYFEAALLIALMGFVATVALARYLERGDVMD
ncbi:MAG: K+/H+ antiporter subunit F [Burkholderiales bacterium]|jgi:multicomponent K+:H+ antiporter subunit F|nr:K+/H+ antiporter subunit F [Burkholderiales bacterium]